MSPDAVDYAGASLWTLIGERLKRSPDASMICDEYGRRLTFAEFALQAEQTAASLQLLGIAPGAVVAWQLTTRLESAVLLAALSRLDVVQVPIVPLFRARELRFIFEETRPDFTFTLGVLGQFDYTAMSRKVVAELGLSTRVLTLSDIPPVGDVAALPPEPQSGSAVRWIFSTSGTSGKPKCVCHTDQTLMAAAELLGIGVNLTSRDTTTTNYPIAHCGGPVCVMGQMIFGNRTVYTEQFQPEAAVALYRREGVTVAGAGLPFYQAYLAEQRKSPGVPVIPTLRALQGGGGPAPARIHHDIQRELGVPLLHVLGMTEALTLTRHPDSDIEDRAHTVGVPGDGFQRGVPADRPRAHDVGLEDDLMQRLVGHAVPIQRSPAGRNTRHYSAAAIPFVVLQELDQFPAFGQRVLAAVVEADTPNRNDWFSAVPQVRPVLVVLANPHPIHQRFPVVDDVAHLTGLQTRQVVHHGVGTAV